MGAFIDRKTSNHIDPDRREQLTQLIISELKQSIPSGTVSFLATNFIGLLLSAAEKVVPRLTQKPRLPGWFEDETTRMEFEQAWTERDVHVNRSRSVKRVCADEHVQTCGYWQSGKCDCHPAIPAGTVPSASHSSQLPHFRGSTQSGTLQ